MGLGPRRILEIDQADNCACVSKVLVVLDGSPIIGLS